MRANALQLLLAFVLMLLLPWLFANLLEVALLKLQISARVAVLIVFGMLFGSLINIPLRRIPRSKHALHDPFAIFGLGGISPRLRSVRNETIIAINVGGCLVPAGLACYEVFVLAEAQALLQLLAPLLLTIGTCYRLARPVPGVGIALPALIPPLIAAGSATLLSSAHATQVAFVAGTLGPLIGADVLHLREVTRIESGVLSIGGAGTFDGIVLSGIGALFLA